MSESWFDGVTWTVEVAFADGPLASAPTYTDVTAYVRGVSTSRGRSDEYSSFSPGTARVVLDNRDRRFDPEYASGPYFGNLLPMRRVRISAVYSATTYRVFTGYVMGWPQSYTNPNDSTVTVQCVDGFRILENYTLAANAYEAAVLADDPLAYFPLQSYDQATTDLVAGYELNTSRTPKAGVGDSNITWFAPSFADNGVPVGAPNALVNGEDTPTYPSIARVKLAGPAPATAPKAVELWYRCVALVRDDSGCSMATTLTNHLSIQGRYVAYSNTADSKNLTLTDGFVPLDGEWHHVVIYADATNLYSRVDGSAYTSAALSAGTSSTYAFGDASSFIIQLDLRAAPTETTPAEVSHLAFYSTVPSTSRFDQHFYAGKHAWGTGVSEPSGTRIGRVLDEAGWPTGLRDIDTGDTPQTAYTASSATALGYIRTVEASEQGAFFIAKDGTATFIGRQAILLDTASTTFSDDGSDTPYFAINVDANTVDAIRNKVTVSYADGDRTAKDDTSVDAYGPVSESIGASTVDKAVVAGELANYRVRLGKDPQTRITGLTVMPRRKPTTAIPAVLGLELMDRVNVERTPQGVGSAIDKDVTVQGIGHSVNPGSGEWTVELYCSPAPDNYTTAPYLVLNDATYGKIGNTAGNLIPF